MGFNWTCPFCDRDTTILDSNYHRDYTLLKIKNKDGLRVAILKFIVCPNEKCQKQTFGVSLWEPTTSDYGEVYMMKGEPVLKKMLNHWNLIPPSMARVFPDYVPKPILDDYAEACLIKDLSPKASASLARRCLQGIIRDFWKISKPKLIDEIIAIKDKIDPLTWQAIDAVRGIGNIGAHMEQDINLIVDIEPNEASLLLELIETLINDWYVARHEREKRLNEIVGISEAKSVKKKAKKKSK